MVADQPGAVRQVVLGDRHVAWTRCLAPDGPTEVWWAPREAGRPRRVPGARAAGGCDVVQIVGLHRDLVVLRTTARTTLARLDAVDVRRGTRRLLEAETLPASGTRIVAADVEGPRVVWLRSVGVGDARVTETVVADLRGRATADPSGAGPGRVVDTRALIAGAVVPTGVRVAPSGGLVVREALAGALYGYGTGAQRLRMVVPPRQLVRVGPDIRVEAADLTDRVLAYTLADPVTGRAWVHLLDRTTGRRRMLRRLGPLPAPVPRAVPALPSPAAQGRHVAWRERTRAAGGYADRVLVFDVVRRRARVLVRLRDDRRQRAFLAPPSVRAARVAWAEVRTRRPAGPVGGFYGLTPPGSRSRVLITPVR